MAFLIPNELLQIELGMTEIAVFAELVAVADNTSRVSVSIVNLARRRRCGENTVRMALRRLASYGVIRIERQEAPDGGTAAHVYEIQPPGKWRLRKVNAPRVSAGPLFDSTPSEPAVDHALETRRLELKERLWLAYDQLQIVGDDDVQKLDLEIEAAKSIAELEKLVEKIPLDAAG